MNDDADRFELDCRCGKTTVGETIEQAEENHLRHFLNDHDDVEPCERERAQEQLENASRSREAGES